MYFLCIRCTDNQVLGKTMLMMIDGNNSKRKRPIEKFLLLPYYVAVSNQWCLKISYGTYILGVQNKYTHKSALDKCVAFSCTFLVRATYFRLPD